MCGVYCDHTDDLRKDKDHRNLNEFISTKTDMRYFVSVYTHIPVKYFLFISRVDITWHKVKPFLMCYISRIRIQKFARNQGLGLFSVEKMKIFKMIKNSTNLDFFRELYFQDGKYYSYLQNPFFSLQKKNNFFYLQKMYHFQKIWDFEKFENKKLSKFRNKFSLGYFCLKRNEKKKENTFWKEKIEKKKLNLSCRSGSKIKWSITFLLFLKDIPKGHICLVLSNRDL